MLKRLYIDNYRCLTNFECRFEQKQLILGPNGSGKTTLFDVLSLLRDFCAFGFQMEASFLGSTSTRWQRVPTQTFEMEVEGNDGHYLFRLIMDSWGHPVRPRVVAEEVLHQGRHVFRFTNGEVQLFNDDYENKVSYPFDWHRSALATITERRENTKLSWFKHWLASMWFISPDPHQMGPLAEREAPAPTRNLSNFACWYRHLRQETDDQELQSDLREVIPGCQSLDLKDLGMGNRFLAMKFVESIPNGQHPNFYNFGELSDGQRVLVGLYTLLHFAMKAGMSLFLDEPDNFISLAEIQPWFDKLSERIEDSGAQVVIISHHPEFLNRMGFHGGLLFDRLEGRHTRVRPFTDVAETGLTPAELVARGWEHE